MLRVRIGRAGLVLTLVLALASLVGLFSLTAAQAREGCTNSSLSGAYGFRETGFFLGNGITTDFAAASRVVFDGHGNFAGTSTSSAGGTIARDAPISGTYAVQSNCTVSMMVNGPGFTVHPELVLVDKGKQAFFVWTDPGTVVSGQGIRQDMPDN